MARRLSSPRRERKAVPSTPIRSPEVERGERVEGLVAEHVLARVHLEPPGAVDDVEEGGAAVSAPRREPAGHAVGAVGLLAVLEPGVLLVHALDRRPRPRRSAGTGRSPSARRRSSFARRSSTRGNSTRGPGATGRREPRLYARSILVILSLRAGPRGTGTVTVSPRLWPSRALPTGDSFESLLSAGSASAEPDDAELGGLVGLLVLHVDGHAHADDVGVHVLVVDHAGAAELVLEVADLLLEHGLLVLGVVVLGVLGDVAELASLLDPLGHLAPAIGAQVLDLGLELLEALRCEDCLSCCHRKTLLDARTLRGAR